MGAFVPFLGVVYFDWFSRRGGADASVWLFHISTFPFFHFSTPGSPLLVDSLVSVSYHFVRWVCCFVDGALCCGQKSLDRIR